MKESMSSVREGSCGGHLQRSLFQPLTYQLSFFTKRDLVEMDIKI
jgi:hypothetical protein